MSNPDGSNNSPSMNLPIPTPGVTPGDDYAIDLNNSLTIIDGHDHSIGSGVQITPPGLNINTALPMNNNILGTVKSIHFQVQTVNAANQSMFFKGVDLYVTDGNGVVIPITTGGAVAATVGTLSGGTATAAFVTNRLRVLSDSSGLYNAAGDVDGASFTFRNITPNSTFGITLSAPAALAANATYYFPPAAPVASGTSLMRMDSSGNIGWVAASTDISATTANAVGQAMNATGANAIGVSMAATGANAVANSRTRAVGTPAAVGGVAKSSSSGSFSTASTTPVFVTNLNVTITGSGRPIMVQLVPSLSNPACGVGGTPGTTALLTIVRGLTTILSNFVATPTLYPVGSFSTLDMPGAGTFQYTVQAQVPSGGGTVTVSNAVLVAWEI